MSTFALAQAVWVALIAANAPSPAAEPADARSSVGEEEVVFLEFREILQPARVPGLSARVRALDGKRVRLIGFMAQMEEPPRGAFYLLPRPVFCDEGGAGTGDLPPEAIRVAVRSSPDVAIGFIPGRLEVTGLLRVGNRADEEGRVSALELLLDSDPAAPTGSAGAARSELDNSTTERLEKELLHAL